MRFRRAATLVATFEDGQVVLCNYLTQSRFTCSEECVGFLAKLEGWHRPKDLFRHLPEMDRAILADEIAGLVGVG
ncbi:MAG TPA: hypothetical protein VGM47_07040, partial [Gammaproteobacteria bacterium]